MKIPKSLFVGYRMLRDSRLLVKKAVDDDSLRYFQSILNKAQPVEPDEHVLHKFVRAMYNDNKNRFMTFIRNTTFECLVLWTDHSTIVNFMGLRGVVHIGWDGEARSYTVTKFRPRSLVKVSHTVETKNHNTTPMSEDNENDNDDTMSTTLMPQEEEKKESVKTAPSSWADVVDSD